MSQAAAPDQEQPERQVRLMIIIGLAAAVFLGGLAVSIIGSRQVSDKATICVKLRAPQRSIPTSLQSLCTRRTPTRCRMHWAPIGWSLFNSRWTTAGASRRRSQPCSVRRQCSLCSTTASSSRRRTAADSCSRRRECGVTLGPGCSAPSHSSGGNMGVVVEQLLAPAGP
jgi:hypothetical protein